MTTYPSSINVIKIACNRATDYYNLATPTCSNGIMTEALIKELESFYEVINYRNALGILKSGSPNELEELVETFINIRIHTSDIISGGGNESNIPKKFSAKLRSLGWEETRISGDLLIKLESKKIGRSGYRKEEKLLEKFIDGHKIDYVKNRVAFDLEWNSKDQTFDRDLYAFGAFYQANIINAGILVTRSARLNDVFKILGVMKKYGASTTWMGKLEYRINANRSSGCPILALGITEKLVDDGETYNE